MHFAGEQLSVLALDSRIMYQKSGLHVFPYTHGHQIQGKIIRKLRISNFCLLNA